MRINIIGDIFNSTGYASHTKSLFNALYKLADVSLSTQLIPGWERLSNDAELDAITKSPNETDTRIIITTPNNWKLFLGTGINIGYCIWEGDRVPVSFISDFLNPKIDLIFVPSIHTEQAIQNTASEYLPEGFGEVMKKIYIIPHGVDTKLFYPIKEKKDGVFRFICNKGWRGTCWDRGGVQYVLKAFAEEFKLEDNVELILKLNQAYINPQFLGTAINNLNLSEDRPLIRIVYDDIPFDKLVHLYNQANCYICATRCESFNLPGLEAMACGLPTIQTNFGGQTDYMTNENSLYIDYKLEPVKEDLMYEGIQWAIPDIEDLKKKMRWAYEHQDDIKKMGKIALDDSKNWTWDFSATKIVKILSDIEPKSI